MGEGTSTKHTCRNRSLIDRIISHHSQYLYLSSGCPSATTLDISQLTLSASSFFFWDLFRNDCGSCSWHTLARRSGPSAENSRGVSWKGERCHWCLEFTFLVWWISVYVLHVLIRCCMNPSFLLGPEDPKRWRGFMLGSFSGPASNSIIEDPNLLTSAGQAKMEKSAGYQKNKIEGETQAPHPRYPNLSLFWILSKWLLLSDPRQHQPASFHGGPVALQARVPQAGLLSPSARLTQTKTDRPQDIRFEETNKVLNKTTIEQEGCQNNQLKPLKPQAA